MAWFLALTSQIILLLLGLFLMIIVLLQRGRGGGLAGAFGGTGGQSAFGTKAGDVFTKITIFVALMWVITAGGSGFFLRAAAEQTGSQFGSGPPAAGATDPGIPNKPAADDVPEQPLIPAGAAPAGAGPTDGDATTPASDAAAPGDEPSSAEPADTPAESSTPVDESVPSGDSPSQN